MLKLLNEEQSIKFNVDDNEMDIKDNAFNNSINSLIQETWDYISNINSLIATFDYEYDKDNLTEIKDILNSVVDNSTINIGMLTKLKDIFDNKTVELIHTGENTAENVINN